MWHKKERFISIHVRITILVVSIFLGVFLLVLFRDEYGKLKSREIESLISLSTLYNEITVNSEECNKMIQDLSVSIIDKSRTFDPEDFQDVSRRLTKASGSLVKAMNEDGYNRNSIDLDNMFSTYLEYCDSTIDAAKTNDYGEINDKYRDCERIYGFIRDKLAAVYRDIQKNYVLSEEQQVKYDKYIRSINFLTLGIIILFAGIFLYTLYRIVTRPINVLSAKTKQFSLTGDNLGPTVAPVKPRNEIDVLNNTLNGMQRRICEQYNLTVEKAELEEKLKAEKVKAIENEKFMKEMELKNLQARINPHFLFNSINLISKMAYMEQAEQTSAMMETLGEFLRYNLDNFSKIVTLGKEIENIKDYTAIQKIRFGSRIDFIVNSDESLEAARIPCLILQPLVENSIIHGVGMYTKGGIVQVETEKTADGRAAISVYDNGGGMSRSELEKIRSMASDPSGPEDGAVGLLNVFKRLRLFFNNDVRIDVSSEQGRYTKFSIDIPIQVNNNGDRL